MDTLFVLFIAAILPENLTDEAFIKRIDPNTVFAEINCKESVQWK